VTGDVGVIAAEEAGRFRRATGPAGLSERLGSSTRELAALGAIILAAAVLRLANLPFRGGWDSDQGTEMLALRSALATGRLPTFGPEAISVTSSFHHGALYYDLLLPAAWLGNGDPTWVAGEIALLSLLVVPIVWWIARSIGGEAAGLTAAFLAAVSAGLIGYATFIWNPTLVEPGAAIAFLGAWQALRTRRPAWWLLAAAGAAIAMQAHVAASVIVVPLAVAFALDLRRAPAVSRGRIAAWGIAGAGLVVATYLPLIVSEMGDGFADTRGMLAYFTDPNSTTSVNPLLRLLFAMIRILAWPLTRWPMIDRLSGVMVAFVTASAIVIGLLWRLAATAGRSTPASGPPAPSPVDRVVPSDRAPSAADARLGTRLIGFWLLLLVLVLGIGLHAVSEVQDLPTEQYHVVADSLVFVAVGLIVGGLWRAMPKTWLTQSRRAVAISVVGGLLIWNIGHWPPLTAGDGGWPAAQAAATRVEQDAGGSAVALVPLFAEKGSDAYLYPLTRDGITEVAPDQARTVVLLCDSYWLQGCGGSAETTWLAANPAGQGLTLVDRFAAAPDRILTVYRRAP
jgi:4-amino-4-deoxy-L-arabinose transferase-like glycosyltransferase